MDDGLKTLFATYKGGPFGEKARLCDHAAGGGSRRRHPRHVLRYKRGEET